MKLNCTLLLSSKLNSDAVKNNWPKSYRNVVLFRKHASQNRY